MRLGLVRREVHGSGGAERTLMLLAQGLMCLGHEVAVATSSWDGPVPQGVRLLSTQAGRGKAGARLFAQSAARAMQEFQPQAWLSLDKVPGCPVYRAGDGVHAAWLARRAPHRSLLSNFVARVDPGHRAVLDLERRTLSHPALRTVVANSRLVAGELERYHGLDPKRVELIYNAVDRTALLPGRDPELRAGLRHELGADGSRPALLFLGSGFERKGLAFALAALAKLPHATLWVVGSDKTGPWQRQAHSLGVEARVRFLGVRGDVPALLGACDALLLPTIYDPCANACLEALCLDVPVVTTSANGASELVQPGVSGVVVEHPQDAKQLARACETALGLPPGEFGGTVPAMEQWLGAMVKVLEQAAEEKP